jgi:hypothetical protein
LGDLGIAMVWVVGAVAVAGIVLAMGSRTARQRARSSGRLATALRFGLVDLRRNPVLLVLLVIVPVVFILLAKATTPARNLMLNVTENGAAVTAAYWFPTVHAGTMTPIAVASLAALAGMFVVVDASDGDRRLRLAGCPVRVIAAARLGVVAAAVIVITVAALAVTASVFDARQWVGYVSANLGLGMTYSLVGVIIGPLLGRVAGVFVAFLLPFLDLGIAQSPMLHPFPPQWAHALPGYGWTKVLFDAGLTAHFDQTGPLLIGCAWLVGLLIAATSVVTRARSIRLK